VSGLAIAIERRQWETVALYLLAGVAAATEKLPPDSLHGLLDVLSEEGRRDARKG
jgi:hypothetical protein